LIAFETFLHSVISLAPFLIFTLKSGWILQARRNIVLPFHWRLYGRILAKLVTIFEPWPRGYVMVLKGNESFPKKAIRGNYETVKFMMRLEVL
jgi:hypothetical protein